MPVARLGGPQDGRLCSPQGKDASKDQSEDSFRSTSQEIKTQAHPLRQAALSHHGRHVQHLQETQRSAPLEFVQCQALQVLSG